MTKLTDKTDALQPLVVGIALAHGAAAYPACLRISALEHDAAKKRLSGTPG
jgi:hypothetical protein